MPRQHLIKVASGVRSLTPTLATEVRLEMPVVRPGSPQRKVRADQVAGLNKESYIGGEVGAQ